MFIKNLIKTQIIFLLEYILFAYIKMLKLSSKIRLITNILLRAQTVSLPSCKTLCHMSIKYSNLRCWQLTSSSFNFTTQKQSTNKFDEKQSVSSILEEYRIKADKLRIHQHFQYFQRVFKTKESINQNDAAWKILNSKLLQYINRLKYYQVILILHYLNQQRIQNPLVKEAETVLIQKIKFANIRSLNVILTRLNIKKIELNAQEEQKYYKVYERLHQIIPIKKNKSPQKNQISFEGPSIIVYNLSKQRKYKQLKQQDQSQSEIKITNYQLARLMHSMKAAKVKDNNLIQYILYNPLTNQKAKQHIQKVFKLNDLKVIFQAFSSQKINKPLKFVIIKNVLKQIMNRQEMGKEFTTDLAIKINFLYGLYYLIENFNSNLKRLQRDDPSSKEENIKFLNELKKYSQQKSKQLQNAKITNIKLKNKAQYIFSKFQRLKNQNIEESITSQKTQNVAQFSNRKLLKKIQALFKISAKDRNKFDQQSSIILEQIWKRYQKFDPLQKKIVANKIYIAQAKYNIKLQIPEGVIVDVNQLNDMIEKYKESKNNKKSEVERQKQNLQQVDSKNKSSEEVKLKSPQTL